MQIVDAIGNPVTVGIFAIAEAITASKSAPGFVALCLFLTTLGFGILYVLKTRSQITAIKQLNTHVCNFEDSEAYAKGRSDLLHSISSDQGTSRNRAIVSRAFEEFDETVIEDIVEENEPQCLRNSIRPSSFLNVEDLGFGPGFFRIVPNTLVSIGLLLTFLGLVAALGSFSKGMENGMEDAMQNFMDIASAKFVMSLVGLFCSIIFTLLLRARQSALDAALHNLCANIEERVIFVSLEDIGFRQLKAATEQRQHLQSVALKMVEELSQPLTALPDQISETMKREVGPILERVGSAGTSNMEGLAGNLADQLSQQVGHALTRASESLGEATDKIGEVIARMSETNSKAGDGLQTALDQMARAMTDMRNEVAESGKSASNAMNEGADRLLSVMNDTLSTIRDNTGQGAEAMREAANEMRSAAEGFRETLDAATKDSAEAASNRIKSSSDEAGHAIENAGQAVREGFEKAGADLADLGTKMGNTIGGQLLSQLDEVGSKLATMSEAIQKGASGAQSAAQGLNSGADAIHGASEGFRSASQSLVTSVEPIRASQGHIETSLRRVSELVNTVSETLMQNSASVAENASHVLETANAALGNEREGIRNSLNATREAIAELADQADNLDQIDQMLGRALMEYNNQLEAALGSAQDHVGQMRDALAPGLDTLKSVVEQAEQFIPEQRRGRA